jgi:tetrahydromethanopterin S-methyltransferase subunit G
MTPDFISWLREEVAKIHTKLDRLDDRIDRVDVILTKQAGDIEHHIRRTDALEERVEQVADELRPVEDHVAMLRGVGKFLGIVATVTGILGGMYVLLTGS